MNVLIAFVIVMTLLLIALIKFKISPGVGLFAAAILMGFLTFMPLPDILSNLGTGFGNTMKSIGIVILFGGIFGELLAISGATEEMAKGLLRVVGSKNDLLALNLAGFIVSIPVYFGSAYIMLSPLVNSLQELTKKKRGSYVSALFVGLLLTHCIVAPTPGPVAVAGQVGANLGWFILYGIVIALPASLIAGWQFGNLLNHSQTEEEKKAMKEGIKAILEDDELIMQDSNKPSAITAFLLILFPITLIVLGSIFSIILPEGNIIRTIFTFLGDNNVALFIAMLVTGFTLRKYIVNDGRTVMEAIDQSSDKLGNILMVIGTGGCFGTILQSSGVGDALVALLNRFNMPLLLLAFLLAMIIRAAVGSATVGMLTTVSIVGPPALAMGFSPVIVGLAICAGSVGLTLPTDAAFWLPARYNNLTVGEAFVTTTYTTTMASVISFLMLLILQAFSSILPGMF